MANLLREIGYYINESQVSEGIKQEWLVALAKAADTIESQAVEIERLKERVESLEDQLWEMGERYYE